MREALRDIAAQAIESRERLKADSRRMDRMRPGGTVLFEAASRLVKAGRPLELEHSSGIERSSGPILETDPVTITFPDPFVDQDPDSVFEIEAELRLLSQTAVALPDGNIKPGVRLIGVFPEAYGNIRTLFIFVEDGSLMNHSGNYVTEAEMQQAENILLEMGLPQNQEVEEDAQLEIFNDPEARTRLNAAFDIWIQRVDPNETFFGRLHTTNAEMLQHIQEQTPIGRRQTRLFERLMQEKNMSEEKLTEMVIGHFGEKTVSEITPIMVVDELPVGEKLVDDEYVESFVAEACEQLSVDHASKTAEAIRTFFTGVREKMKPGEELVFDMFQPEGATQGVKLEKREEGLFVVSGYPIDTEGSLYGGSPSTPQG